MLVPIAPSYTITRSFSSSKKSAIRILHLTGAKHSAYRNTASHDGSPLAF
jgi:hypothetical protein